MAGEQTGGLNQLKLTARLIARDIVRYTPAGQTVINFQLEYQGEVLEAAIPRKVSVQIAAITIGSICGTIEKMEIGQLAHFEGFLAHKSLRSQALIFHITTIHF